MRESVVLEDVALEESHEVVDVYLTGLQKKEWGKINYQKVCIQRKQGWALRTECTWIYELCTAK